MPGAHIFQGENDQEDNCWLTAIVVNAEVTGWEPSELARAMSEANIETRPIWKPMHLQPVFAHHRAYTNGVSERLFASGLTLPSGPGMSDDETARVHRTIEAFLGTHE